MKISISFDVSIRLDFWEKSLKYFASNYTLLLNEHLI